MSRVIWITGASKGIGWALARHAAAEGWTVAASARGEDGLKELADGASGPGEILPYPLDVMDLDAVKACVAKIEDELGAIDTAVLNAGTHADMAADAFDAKAAATVINLNMVGTTNCLEPLIKTFLPRGAGRIALVASVAGYRGLPRAAAYCGSKAGVIAMAESLAAEIGHRGVTVQVICPGFVRTPLTDKNEFPMPFIMEPEEAAKRIWRGLRGNNFEIAFPKRFVFQLKTLASLPPKLYFAAVRKATGI